MLYENYNQSNDKIDSIRNIDMKMKYYDFKYLVKLHHKLLLNQRNARIMEEWEILKINNLIKETLRFKFKNKI